MIDSPLHRLYLTVFAAISPRRFQQEAFMDLGIQLEDSVESPHEV